MEDYDLNIVVREGLIHVTFEKERKEIEELAMWYLGGEASQPRGKCKEPEIGACYTCSGSARKWEEGRGRK